MEVRLLGLRVDPGHPLFHRRWTVQLATAVVDGLAPGESYYFAARATDEAGNSSTVTRNVIYAPSTKRGGKDN